MPEYVWTFTGVLSRGTHTIEKMGEELKDDREEGDEVPLRQALRAPETDLRAFEQLILGYQKRIVADCRYMTRDESNAEDLAQEVFVKAFFGLRGFEGRSSFRHWLQRIKVHHCLNHIKRQEGKKRVPLDDGAAEESEQFQVPATAHRDFEAMDNRARIKAILESRPSTLRIPLVMRDMDEISYEEIAASLHLGLSAVKMRIKRAREEFRRRYASA